MKLKNLFVITAAAGGARRNGDAAAELLQPGRE